MMTMLLIVVAILPAGGEPMRDSVDVAEVNHFYDERGKHVFTQLVFWQWRPLESDYRVVAWRLPKSDGARPRRDHVTGDWVSRWWDGETFREVRAGAFRETWTQTDVEQDDRSYLPKEQRRELRKDAAQTQAK